MKYDVVFLWKQNDSGIYGRRADMILKELSLNQKIGNIIHFDAPINIDTLIKYNICEDAANHQPVIHDITMDAYAGKKKVYGVKSYTYIYSKRGSGRKDYHARNVYFKYVEKIIKENGIGEKNKILLWNCPVNYDLSNWIKFLKPAYVISDIIDDQRAWSQNKKTNKKMTCNYKFTVKASDLLLVNSKEMQDRVINIDKNAAKKLHLVSNGCEGFNTKILEKPDFLKTLKGPVIGLASNLEKKIDIELLEKCALKHPEWNIVLIGSTHASDGIERLFRYENIRFCGVIPYEEAKRYIYHFDAAIIPHRIIDVNKAMNPLKLYVYCSLGVDVVSTNIPGIDDLKGIIRVANTHDGFIEQIERALKEKKKYNENEISLINSYSWKNKVEKIFNYIGYYDYRKAKSRGKLSLSRNVIKINYRRLKHFLRAKINKPS